MATLITTHKNPDFDGFASAMAAKFLYSDSYVVIEGIPQQNLLEFINIYKPFYIESKNLESYLNENNINSVEKIVITDTANISRIPPEIKIYIENGTETDIYDHHPALREDNNIYGNNFSRECGSATTLVLEKLLCETNDLPDVYETLFLIAIHEDTGNFLYPTTTPLDHMIAGELIKMGARIEEINEFVSLDMTEEQKNLFNDLYTNILDITVGGIKVNICFHQINKFIGGLNVITHKLLDTLSPDVLFSIVKMEKNIYIVGRSKTDEIDLNKVLESFNGGGHKKAGAAKVKNGDMQQVTDKIIKKLKSVYTPSLKAEHIMSSPVRTVPENEKIEKVYQIMEQTGHSGIPIITKNKLSGMVTKKDVEKAIKHNLGHAPIKSIMSSKLKVVEFDSSISAIRRIMAEEDIGRVPVMKNNILVGIITRSDILRASNGIFDFSPNPILDEKTNIVNIKNKMDEKLPSRVMSMLRLLGTYGSEISMNVYVVGGFVRDLILGVENYDIDIVVEGNAHEFGKFVSERLKIKYVEYKAFNTCSLFFKDGFRIDVATARTEYYNEPADLPKIEISSIKKDLYRRDFSINAMAIKINPGSFGHLLDFFGCKKDIENKTIKILYPLSFIEDPTRIIRCLRFEQRYGFTIEEDTMNHLKNAINEGYLERVSGSRLREELEKIMKERNFTETLDRLGKLKIFYHMFPGNFYTPAIKNDLVKIFEIYYQYKEKINDSQVKKFHILLYPILQYCSGENTEFISNRYGLPKYFFTELFNALNALEKLSVLFEKSVKYSEIYEILNGFSHEQIIFILSKLSEDSREKIYEYINKIKNIKMPVDGKQLKNKGLKGIEIKNELERIKKELLDS